MTRWFPTVEMQRSGMSAPVVEALRHTQATADTRAANVSFSVRSNPAGVFDPATEDLIVRFFEHDIEIANRTIRGVLDVVTGEFTLTSPAVNTGLTNGELTTVVYFGTSANNVGDSVRADVTHTESKIVGSAAFSAVDASTSGSIPSVVIEGGGGGWSGGGGGSK